ncbi:MAG: acyl-ACP--UDP-N-acetylglucosamine O-acyltransferase [Alphaproteobacteria bacterium]|nr:MAG: acyl-ACP--UDP-N-acetylglucosamine O-acyltransferase [Alphaproteobacteria bacterium]
MIQPFSNPPENSVTIHPTAIIAPGARLGENVQIGPYCVLGARVTLGDNVRLHSHVVIEGNTEIGEGTEIFPFASIGHVTQDLKYSGEDSLLIIGKNNKIREYATLQGGTQTGIMKTVVGDNCLLMASTHVAHDCLVGNNVILANNATLAGHVEVGDNVNIGGLSGIHQFVKIGSHAIIGGLSAVESDVIPFGLVKGDRAFLSGLNIIGLRRRGFTRERIDTLMWAYEEIFRGVGTRQERIDNLKKSHQDSPDINMLIAFVEKSTRGLCVPRG